MTIERKDEQTSQTPSQKSPEQINDLPARELEQKDQERVKGGFGGSTQDQSLDAL
jgi:hypothetical protein